LRIALGIVIFEDFGAPYIDIGGRRGSPLKVGIVVFVYSKRLVMDSRSASLNKMERSAIVIEEKNRNTLIRNS